MIEADKKAQRRQAMKHLFIINPAAGSRDRTADYTAEIQRLCKGLDYEIAVSQAPGECRRLAREAAQTGEKVRIYAAAATAPSTRLPPARQASPMRL